MASTSMVIISVLILFHIIATHASASQPSSAPCPALPPHAATSIRDLRPNDVKVIMAVGDSITAGFGIQGSTGTICEYRGQSWAIGGDPGAVTLPNFFKQYTPTIQGPSIGSHILEACFGQLCPSYQYRSSIDEFNSAQSGALVSNLAVHELDYLITQLNQSQNVDMKNDWKVMTLLIGANDLCSSCTSAQKDFLTPEQFGVNLTATIERVRKDIPRLFVNLVELFNLSQVYDLSLQKPSCALKHRTLFIECDCIFGPGGAANRLKVDTYVQGYNEQMREIAARYTDLDNDFAVVIQPFARDMMVKDLDIDFLSDLDCFHPSLLAHQAIATALWNSMLTPASQKQTTLNLTQAPICPTESTRLYVN